MENDQVQNNSEKLAETLLLHREWNFYVKRNHTEWFKQNFIFMNKVKTIKDMWQLLNNIDEKYTGLTNLFFMEYDIIPLWEENKNLWSNGGCWSTIIKGRTWIESMHEICMIVMGESVFDENEIKGICIVPVGTYHSIIKLWTTTNSQHIAAQLQNSLHNLNCCPPKFKAFS